MGSILAAQSTHPGNVLVFGRGLGGASFGTTFQSYQHSSTPCPCALQKSMYQVIVLKVYEQPTKVLNVLLCPVFAGQSKDS